MRALSPLSTSKPSASPAFVSLFFHMHLRVELGVNEKKGIFGTRFRKGIRVHGNTTGDTPFLQWYGSAVLDQRTATLPTMQPRC